MPSGIIRSFRAWALGEIGDGREQFPRVRMGRPREDLLGGSALALVLINLVLSFAISGISIGGHIGGLVGGALCTLVLSHFGRGHAAYTRVGLWGIAGVLGVGLLSIAVAYWRVRGYA